MYQEKISKEQVNELPIVNYSGISVVIESSEILESVRGILENTKVFGFDTETKPVFKKGQKNEVSLIQLALEDRVYLIRIFKSGLPNWLVNILSDENRLKIGVGLKDDIKDLQRLKPFTARGFVDLGNEVKKVGIDELGLRKIAGILLKGRISKSAQTSNWENEILTEKQIKYAATDAWACLEMYKILNS